MNTQQEVNGSHRGEQKVIGSHVGRNRRNVSGVALMIEGDASVIMRGSSVRLRLVKKYRISARRNDLPL